MVPVVGLEEVADLCLAPLGLGKSRRADHDKELRVVQRIVNTVRQRSGGGKFVLVAERVPELPAAKLLAEFLGDRVALDLLLDALGRLLVERKVAVADEGDVVALAGGEGACGSCFGVLILVIRDSLILLKDGMSAVAGA